MEIVQKIIKDLIKARINTPVDLVSFKRRVSKKYKVPCLSNIELLKAYHKLVQIKRIKRSEVLEKLLKTRPIRSLSGIVNVSVLTKPYPCPGKCLYCPQEIGIPKSYVSGEPAVERAKKLNYDPYWQTKKRIEMLKTEGHPTDKIELRIVGGTWSYYPRQYQNWFTKRCFDACNKANGENLKKAQELNERAKYRMVGLSIETRPDFINLREIRQLRKLGVTLVELGVQSIYNNVLKLNKRGHGVKAIIKATKLLKDAGFKILYQIMPNLPGSNLKKDEKMFEELFQNPDFQPDYLKIYPCALLKEAPLYKWWKAGKYKPYTQLQLINLLKSIKKPSSRARTEGKIPYYVRIQRIARDIPSQNIIAGGAKISNLRQIIYKESKRENWQCKCIRCREVKENYNPKDKLYLFRQNYIASGDREIFLSFETKNREKLYSLLRLRIMENTAIIREIQTFGEAVPIGVKKIASQHQGLGKKLTKEAEKIVKKEFGLKKIFVIAGVGARNYFRKLGYRLKNSYMARVIK